MEYPKQDVVVIGAGVIGLATAYELRKRGLEVTVVDEKRPGWAASHGNAGMIYPAAGEPMVNPFHMKAGLRWMLTRGGQSPFQVSLLRLPSLAGWGMRALGACNRRNYENGKRAFQALGADVLRQFEDYKTDGVEYEEHPGGFISAFVDEQEFDRLSSLFGQDSSNEVLTGDQAREREPLLSEDVVGAVRLTGFLELSGVNMRILPRRIRALKGVASRYLKRVPTGETEEHWTGMRACTPDGLPAIGRLSGLANGWVGSGHWHFGLTLAPPTAIMLAELITTNQSTVDQEPFSPERF